MPLGICSFNHFSFIKLKANGEQIIFRRKGAWLIKTYNDWLKHCKHWDLPHWFETAGRGAGKTPEGKRSLLLGPPAALIIMNRYYLVPGLAEAVASLSRDWTRIVMSPKGTQVSRLLWTSRLYRCCMAYAYALTKLVYTSSLLVNHTIPGMFTALYI